MTLITLVRHGQTDWNFDRRIQGSTDIPLNDMGRAQAREAGRALHEEARGDTIVVASDLARARETAEIIARELGLEAPRLYPELRERAYGEAEGMMIDDVPLRFGSIDRNAIPGAELSADLRARGVRALRVVARDARAGIAPHATHVIAVSHGALIAELIRHASGDTLPLPGERLANASRHTFVVDGGGLGLVSYVAEAGALA